MMRVLLRVLGRPLETRGSVSSADAIVVLGAPIRADGSLPPIVEERVVAGVELWRRGVAPLVVMTGGPTRGVELPEADGMALRARELGVPAATLRVERVSRFTRENAELCAPILRAEGVRRVIVVTQPFHLRRGVLWFRRVGFEAVGHHIEGSVQFADVRRGLRWVLREYPALVRDLLDR
jgi:uncharacterized SAM-binding protein YcdF (DUF218 family)